MRIIIVLIAFFLASCHHTDVRLRIINQSDKSIAFRIGNLKELSRNDVSVSNAFRNLSPTEKKQYIIYTSWESRFADDSLIYVIALPNSSLKLSGYCCIPLYDSLKRAGDFLYRKYSFDELVEKKWLVRFPDDGFKQGDSLLYK